MPRDSNGTYTLYTPGNPVVAGTVITSAWANNTMADIASALTGSLARNGDGGMTGVLRIVDGIVSAPGLTFGNELNMGIYRIGAGQIGISTGSVLRATFDSNGITGTHVGNGSGLTNLNASNLASGTVADARFPATLPAISGANLTNLNATNLATGTVADARLSANVALRGSANTFTGTQIVRGAAGLRFEIQNSGDLDRGGFLSDTGTAFRIGTNSGVRGIEFAPDGIVAGSIGAARNWTINAPASGTALDVNGAGPVTQQLFFGAGPGLRLASTNFNYELRTVDAGGVFELARNDGVAAVVLSINSSRAITINTPASGTALTVNGGGGVAAALQGTNGTLFYDAVVGGFGDLYYTGGPGNVLRVGPRGYNNGGVALTYTTAAGAQQTALSAAAGTGAVAINAPTSGVAMSVTGNNAALALNVTAGTGALAANFTGSNLGGIAVLGGSAAATDACIQMDGNAANSFAFRWASNLHTTGASTPTLSANKPGANAGVIAWLRVSTGGGVTGWVPVFGN
jgi:hypothetical protein